MLLGATLVDFLLASYHKRSLFSRPLISLYPETRRKILTIKMAQRMEEAMHKDQRIEVAELVENQSLGRFQFFVLGCCFLILFVDGLDYSAANVGAPAVIRAFHTDKSAMGLVFG